MSAPKFTVERRNGYTLAVRPDEGALIITPDLARVIESHAGLVEALERMRLDCAVDPLNPCWDNRTTDVAGRHWGGGDACPQCHARAALAKARGEA